MRNYAIIIVVLLILLCPVSGYACKCKPEESISLQERISSANYVAVVVPVRVSGDSSTYQFIQSFFDYVLPFENFLARNRIYTFKVTQQIKGDFPITIKAVTGFGHGDCGQSFTLDKQYLLISSTTTANVPFRAHSCGDDFFDNREWIEQLINKGTDNNGLDGTRNRWVLMVLLKSWLVARPSGKPLYAKAT